MGETSMNFLTRATLSAFFALALVSITHAQAQEPSQAAPPQANDFYSLQKQADAGDAQAQFALGNLYFRGLGVAQDYTQALIWYRRPAAHGNSNAENQLGYMAEEGWGQPQDYVAALSWYYKAADHGNADAQENIGYIFQHGTGVQIDYRQAMSWFYKAAGQGNS